jgi:ABC-type amino acid transport substrate-binding protein
MKVAKLPNRSLPIRIAAAFVLLAAAPWAHAQPAAHAAQAVRPAAASTLERVRASGRIVLGYYTAGQPMSYRDASGNAAGYAVTLCRQVADEVKAELGLQKLALEWVPLTPATGMAAVRQGQVDLLCGAEVASLKNRANVSFSLPVFPGGISALVRADASKAFQNALEERPIPYRTIWRASPFSPLQHKTASVIAGTPTVDLLKEGVARRHLIGKMDLVDSYEAGVANVLSRDSDVFFGDRATLLALARHSADAGKLRVLTRHYTYEPLALALPRNDDDFRLVVDRALIRFYASPKFGDAYTEAFGPPDADTVEYFRGMPR